jgi:hypothetical protein
MHGTLSDSLYIQANWTRSVNVERDMADWASGSAHYTLTPMARSIMDQAVNGILQPKATRAFTITGPYGTGKSAFALALTNLFSLGGPESGLHRDLKLEDPELAAKFQRVWEQGRVFLPVVISGRREALIPALAQGLRRALNAHTSHKAVVRNLVSRIDVLEPGDAVGLTALFEETAQLGGVLLIIDELGKFLEFMAQNPDQGDVFVLQLLAEAAARSDQSPFLMFAILHQAFVRYGAHLTQSQREEFSKVQGRFQDIAFNQSHDLMLRLVGNAIQTNVKDPEVERRLRGQVNALAEHVVKGGLGLGGVAQKEAVALLTHCAPIHPITALILGPMFRRLAQNERSLFTFISSAEPFGLREFLLRTPSKTDPIPLYTPDLLYDYVMSALGTALYQDIGGRRWSQIDATLERMRDGSSLEVRIVKAIGLLAAVGETGNLRAAPDILTLCFAEPAEEIQVALTRLVQRKVLVYRSFVDSYRLWEGSDLDIEERLTAARSFVDEAKGLDELLATSVPQRPIMARRNSFERGTLRFFEVQYTAYLDMANRLVQSCNAEADGRVVYVVVESAGQEQELVERLESGNLAVNDSTVVVPLYLPPALHGAALELERLKWVQDNTPELVGDSVARRELSARLYETEQILRRELERALSSGGTDLICIWKGACEQVKGPRGLNQFLSQVCDQVYDKTPVIQNELINRRQLSSAAAAARRSLMEAMLRGVENLNLGIEGHPPQLSMYLSVLAKTGLHVGREDGVYRFVAPGPDTDLAAVWETWNRFLTTCRTHRRSLRELWDELTRPPFGLREGVIPVLILGMLLERHVELGLYEANSFIPDLTVPHLERFMRTPEKFEVRYCPMDGLRLEVFAELSRVVGSRDTNNLVPLVRALVRNMMKLPPFAQKTNNLSDEARRVRSALMSAREPDVLLFKDLPEALGFSSLLNDEADPAVVQPFVTTLVSAISELNGAHRFLLEKLFSLVTIALGLPSNQTEALQELAKKVRVLKGTSFDLRVKGFLDHLDPPAVPDLFDTWIESLGSYVASRPPTTWNDNDLARFEAELSVLARRLKGLEDIAFERGQFGSFPDADAVRLGLTTDSGEELYRVVILAPEQQERFRKLEPELEAFLQQHNLLDDEDLMATLAMLTQRLLKRTAIA